jgi:hypothetical protein
MSNLQFTTARQRTVRTIGSLPRTALLLLLVLALLPLAAVIPATKASAATPNLPSAPSNSTQGATKPIDAATLAAKNQAAANSVTPTDGTYQVSNTVYSFLAKSLGVPIGSSPNLTGMKSGTKITLTVGAPTSVPVPSGIAAPAFGNTTLTIDTVANTLIVQSTASGTVAAKLKIVISHASTSTLTSVDWATALSITAPVLNERVTLTGSLKYKAGALAPALIGFLPADAVLRPGVATVSKGAQVIVKSSGVHISGSATIGSGPATTGLAVSGVIAAPNNWSLSLTPPKTATNWTPLTGIAELPAFTGTLTDNVGKVRFDVTSTVPVSWSPTNGVNLVTKTVEYANTTPPVGSPAGQAAGTAWINLAGHVAVPAGSAGTLNTTGSFIVNLANGKAALLSSQNGTLTLATTPARVVASMSVLRGTFTVGATSISGSVTGNAQVSIGPDPAQATLAVSAEGSLIISFPADISQFGLGPMGDFGTVVWASAPVASYLVSGTNNTAPLTTGFSALNVSMTAPPGGSQQPPANQPPANQPPANQQLNSSTATPTPSPTAGKSSTYGISSSVQQFLNSIGVSLNSTTLTGTLSGSTLTLTVSAPSNLPISLPVGDQALTFGQSTIRVDVTTGALTLSATATASNGTSATLSVQVAHVSTTSLGSADLTATLHISALPVFGATVDLDGSLTFMSGKVGVSVMGMLTSDAVVVPGSLVVSAGTIVSVSTEDGLQVNGTVIVGSGNTQFEIAIKGSITNLKNWSLSVSDAAGAPSFTPIDGLTLTPNFTGSLSDADGTIGFDVSGDNVVSWSPGGNVTVALTHIEVSNQAPPKTLACPADITDGMVWLDVQGQLTYAPANLTASVEGCVNPSGKTFTLTTSAMVTLPSSAGFTINQATVTVDGDLTKDQFTVSANAVLTITALAAQPTFAVGLTFGTDGSFVAGIALPDPAQLGFTGDNASLFVSAKTVKNFDPAKLGITGLQSFDLPAGVTVTVGYQVPQNAVNALKSLGIPINSTAVELEATLSTTGFSAKIALGFGSGDHGVKLLSTGGATVYLNSVYLGVSLSAENTSFTVGGTALLVLPPLYGSAGSQVEVTINGSISLEPVVLSLGFDLSGVCGSSSCPWQNAFGIPGLSVDEVAGRVGLDFTTEIPTPTLSIAVKNLVLPANWATAIGMVPGAQVSLSLNLDVTQPILTVQINGTNDNPVALTPLAISSNDPNVVNSLDVNTAQLLFAPLGGTDATGVTLTPGVGLVFDGLIGGINVHVDASVGIAPPSLAADISIGNFSVGTLILGDTSLHLSVTTDGFDFHFQGGFNDSVTGVSFSAGIDLTASTSLFNAGVNLTITGGQPAYLQGGANLSGYISFGSDGFTFSASGYAYLIIGGSYLGEVSLSYSIDGGALWRELSADAAQVAQAFKDAYGWADYQVTATLQTLQYTATQAAGAISIAFNEGVGAVTAALINAGDQLNTAAQAVANALNASDQEIAAALRQYGFSPDQIASTLQNVFADSQAAIYNALQVVGAGGQQAINQIAGFFNSGSYNISVTAPGWFPMEMDVSGGSMDPNAGVIQWTWNGGHNQDWYILPTDSGYAELVNRNSGQCLSVGNNSYSAGQQLVQYPCYGGANQQWNLGVYPGNSDLSYQSRVLQSRSSGLVADVTGASYWAGANVEQWYYNGGWNQTWTFTPAIG